MSSFSYKQKYFLNVYMCVPSSSEDREATEVDKMLLLHSTVVRIKDGPQLPYPLCHPCLWSASAACKYESIFLPCLGHQLVDFVLIKRKIILDETDPIRRTLRKDKGVLRVSKHEACGGKHMAITWEWHLKDDRAPKTQIVDKREPQSYGL